ncbi:transglycosylase domain-containing protein [Heliorestis convoluta]|uniref:Penicillin-binding protein 1A n=1 Tax=Heliorestis convoluta TaxID=356322 RepID=A0A5Q2MWN5_9FIRM|nr:PBP1A family penicillin-binding protein [Heliorestis convoluta]QGG46944.1 PBP1A family penicillin-binding protein [Heliorestis convoluta]
MEDFEVSATSFIYDSKGTLLFKLHGAENRIPVTIEEVPQHLRNAFIAAEDIRFFRHHGFDPQSILRAMKVNYQSGYIAEGASTITQQLVRNVYLSPERTWRRKVKEIHIAYHLEKELGKNKVLELYLNRIYFGEGAYGVEAAARTFFGKSVQDLSIAEAALIAGIPKTPTFYNPFNSNEAAMIRRNTVLHQMYQYGFINYSQWQESLKEPIHLAPSSASNQHTYPFFIDEVIREAISVHGIKEEALYGGGLHIYTTLDRAIQEHAEDLFARPELFPPSHGERPVEAALASIDPLTGHVKALVGGRRYETRRSFNRATMMRRSPGSTIKPLAVYAPALEDGWEPQSLLVDQSLSFRGYEPKNYDGFFRGQTTMVEAVALSVNVPAVWLLDQIGVSKGFNTMKDMGLPLSTNDKHLALALGGMAEGFSPLDMAKGYAVFANGGMSVEPRTIIQIYDAQENALVQPPQTKEVLSFSTAKKMTELLQSAVVYGTGREAMLSRPVAGKTGTSELPPIAIFNNVKGNRDAWFVGYTPELVTAVWMGYDQTDGQHYLRQIYGGSYPARLFRNFTEGASTFLDLRSSHVFTQYPPAFSVSPPYRENRSDEETENQEQDSSPTPLPVLDLDEKGSDSYPVYDAEVDLSDWNQDDWVPSLTAPDNSIEGFLSDDV